MIASKAGLSYMDFLVVLAPIVVVMMAVFLLALWLIIGRSMTVAPHLQDAVLALNERDAVRDGPFLVFCLGLLMLTTLGFCFHGMLGLEPATVALLGAGLFMLAGYRQNGAQETEELDYLMDVEWKTIFFFIGLFILVGGLVKVGAIRYLADQLLLLTQGQTTGTTLTILWGSAVISAIVDNIPYVAAMNPLIGDLARSLHPETTDYAALVRQPDVLPLWWALALGACLGGNGTMIGATANVVVVDMARRAGHTISFWRFLVFGFPVMIGTVLLSTVYLWLLFLL
jgi:Na+/H+ antiporter NhaD/arsenite permease-like protein